MLQKEIKDLTIELCNLSTHCLFSNPFLYGTIHLWRPYGRWAVGEGVGSWNLALVYELTDLLFIFADGKCVGIKKMFLFFVNVIIVWQLILKVTSIKRNVFSFSLLRFKPNILHANWRLHFFFREYFKELHQHSIYCVLWKNVK